MRKFILFITVSLFGIYSCNEDFNVQADFIQRSVLNTVLRSDTTSQVMSIYNSYPESQIFEDSIKPFISGADVKLWQNYELYQFDERTITTVNNEGKSVTNVYYVCDTLSIESGSTIDIEAILPNGILLTSTVNVPDTKSMYVTAGELLVPAVNSPDEVYIGWNGSSKYLYVPKMYINFRHGSADTQSVQVPLLYQDDVPVYAKPENSAVFRIDRSVFDRTMSEISEGDPNKNDYVIFNAALKIGIYDRDLSSYYVSTQQFADEFTIKLDEPDYSNVSGGFGIAGSYIIKSFEVTLEDSYVRSFGYLKLGN